MSNKLMRPVDAADRIVPPSDPQERINFWIARGNALLEAEGKQHLHWVWANGSYSIEPRPTAKPKMLVDQSQAAGAGR